MLNAYLSLLENLILPSCRQPLADSIGYPHNSRADNAAYRHDRRANNAA